MNVEKYKKGDFKNVLRENYRDKDKQGNYVRYKNSEINASLTRLNKRVGRDTPISYADCLELINTKKSQMSNKDRLNRKDVNIMASIVLTLPEEYRSRPQKWQNAFFVHAYRGLCEFVEAERYDNALGGFLHLDETSPHMHFDFMPITDDGKGGQKISFKEAFPRKKYQELHPFMSDYMSEKLGEPIKLYEPDKEKPQNKSIKELKNETIANHEASVALKDDLAGEISRRRKEIEKKEQSIAETSKTLLERSEALKQQEQYLSELNARLNEIALKLQTDLNMSMQEKEALSQEVLDILNNLDDYDEYESIDIDPGF